MSIAKLLQGPPLLRLLRCGRSVRRGARSRPSGFCARPAAAAAALLLLLLAACGGGPDEVGRALERRALCERALRALGPEGARVEAVVVAADGSVTLHHVGADRAATAAASADALTCRFVRTPDGRLDLAGVASAREGELSPAALFFLRAYALGRAGPPAPPRLGAGAYLAQQLLNATAPAAIYGLLALGYALLYGLIGRVNLAFGEFCAFGTLAALGGALLAGGGEVSTWTTAAAAVLAVLPLGAALGAAAHALVLRPLARRTPLAFLVATLGLSLALGELVRLAQGSRDRWFPPGLARPLALWRAAGGEGGAGAEAMAAAAVTVSTGQLLVAGLALAAFAAVTLLMRRTAFGRAWRACADDPGAAALVGVDTDRTLRRSAMLSAACAALAGAAVSLHYGIVGPGAGLLLGLKALAAAVVGGIGSPAGAVLGGLAVGALETLWAAYLPGEWREAAILGLLALALALRPHGLLGRPLAAHDPALWRSGRG